MNLIKVSNDKINYYLNYRNGEHPFITGKLYKFDDKNIYFGIGEYDDKWNVTELRSGLNALFESQDPKTEKEALSMANINLSDPRALERMYFLFDTNTFVNNDHLSYLWKDSQ